MQFARTHTCCTSNLGGLPPGQASGPFLPGGAHPDSIDHTHRDSLTTTPQSRPAGEGSSEPSEDAGSSGSSGKRRGALGALKLLVSVGLVVWILSRADLAEVGAALVGADLRLVAAAFALNVVGWCISITRWRLLLRARDVVVSPFRMLQAYLSAVFFNNLLPSTVGGDSLRMYESWRWGAGKAGAVAVVGVDRLMGILVLLSFAVVALFLAPQIVEELPFLPLWLGGGALGILGLAGLGLLPVPGVRRWLQKRLHLLPDPVVRPLRGFGGALQSFRDRPRALWGALGLSALLQLNVLVHFYLIALSLSLDLSFVAFFLVIPIVLALMAIPISVNAIGIRENAFVFFLGLFGVGLGDALAFAWVGFGLVLLQGALGGIVYALRRKI